MRNVAWVFIVVGTWYVASPLGATDSTPTQERGVFDTALRLAGAHLYADLRFVLVSELPRRVSRGAEAWTVFDEQGKGDRIFVYTRSRTFRCASTPHPDQNRCLLKLASVIVHEAWHMRNGLDEVGAYNAQLVFLQMKEALAFLQVNEAAALDMIEVRRARDRARANQQKAKAAVGVYRAVVISSAPPSSFE